MDTLRKKSESINVNITPAASTNWSVGAGSSPYSYLSSLYLDSNLYSSSAQTRSQAAQSYNASLGGSGGTTSFGSAIPNANSLWVTPSGAVVTWSGTLVASPPTTKS